MAEIDDVISWGISTDADLIIQGGLKKGRDSRRP